MDLELGETYTRFRDEVRRFLEESWSGPDGLTEEAARTFREAGIERGYIYRYFPKRYGGAEQPPDSMKDDIIQSEYARVDAPLGIMGTGPDMLIPTLLKHGTEELREEFIAKTLTGEITWCQGYSEPGAGSDLAALSSRAELEGDTWVINGHKIWTSDGLNADWMFGLFRTEPDKPRSRGITYLLIPIDQPGVDVRPLKQMTGDTEFCEVYFDDARTHERYTIGGRGGGWKISQTTLEHERGLIGNPRKSRRQFDDLVELARTIRRNGRAAIEDPGIRRRMVEIEGYLLSQVYTHYRQLSATSQGRDKEVALPMLLSKLHTNQISDMIVRLGLDLADAEESLRSPDVTKVILGPANVPGGWMAKYLFAHGSALGGGAPNIQRNLIGERGLGLPRDLRGRPEARR
jgi:alkylation response protein AidB-like acyl-CoA dehydrogenase